MSTPGKPGKPYISNGQVLESPPLTTRIIRWIDDVYFFFGLYFVTLFSLDPLKAAEESKFNIRRSGNSYNNRPRWGGSSGGGGPGGPGGGGGGPRRIGRVDDIRGPECKSCG
ncbi:hypothetical protein DTO166G4_5724 [Paecilomyces variotii]|uniref:Selenoprotein K n=1 Tax=Byssochlamys spectabilis TaxID=264951 RepID=A0A443I4F2_BYSSP|nr:hypothetical protein C8Q69DRAFT_4144 [Paecilomyces variotii]KAJ9202959.1 hypothetical protein DTO032I3_3333 [Paecilomyces variotii]KAJ9204975.1 hypothetical protein DTO164E3_1598 [Paecilomyces variotii]KAJ9212653.1 hypothetical protein DTO166G4_5724 [Paecilomyces variotii]KAJ9226590.1 hypothetical protein DTO169C6_1318 [Paecilomyces variotii]KAJ9243056.1 hypothetical protein DTO166G5_160 [Paecilomyces variotii]